MSFYPRRCSWKRMSLEQQEVVAKTAARLGIRAAAEKHVVSETAVRRACVMTGCPPRDMRMLVDRESKILRAINLLKAVGLTPEDLIKHNNAPADTVP